MTVFVMLQANLFSKIHSASILSTFCLLSIIISSGKSKTSDRSYMLFFQNLNSAQHSSSLVCLGKIECKSNKEIPDSFFFVHIEKQH